MTFLTRASLKNRLIVGLLTLAVAAMGLFSMSALKQELMPSMQVPMAFVSAQSPGLAPEEMARTFNCGIGMVLAVAAEDAAGVQADLEAAGETVFVIGGIEPGERGCTVAGGAEVWSARESWSAKHLA